MPNSYDVIIIGSGPGGYVCAIRCAQLGLKTACVEKSQSLGGTCLNVGCIPSKALLHASEHYELADKHLDKLGIKVGDLTLDLKSMMKHKSGVVDANVNGVEFLFKKNKIDWLLGQGSIGGLGTVIVGETSYTAKHIIIATGSDVISLPGIKIDEKFILSSTGALSLPHVPKTLTVIGGGYIGLELGSVWQRLGSKVTIIEYLDRILPSMDGEISKEMLKILKRQGMTFKLNTKVLQVHKSKTGVVLDLESAKTGNKEDINSDAVLVAIGRKPYTKGLGLEKAGVELDEKGRIKIDKKFMTSVKGIYAIGDVVAGPMLAHKAEDEGVVLAEILAGQSGHIDYNTIPGVVYTSPEAAQVGLTEEQLNDKSISYNVGKFPFTANGRARAMNATHGFVKILADAKTDRILGAHIIGANAGTLIAEIVLGMEFGASSEDIARTCHAHPTLGEAIKEAALSVDKRPIHI